MNVTLFFWGGVACVIEYAKWASRGGKGHGTVAPLATGNGPPKKEAFVRMAQTLP